ncbi:Do family serine endopeptidase [Thermodesulfobacteriota bacterium]
MRNGGIRAIAINLTLVAALVLVVGGYQTPYAKSAPASLRELGDAFAEIADKVTPAVVNISSTKKRASGMKGLGKVPEDHPLREFFGDEFFKRHFKGPFRGGPGGGLPRQGTGSGVIVSPDGLILTNAHVVKDADEIKVTLSNKRVYDAKVKGLDKESDIAVIQIEAKDLPTAQMGNSDDLRVGEIVVAVGNPFGFNRTVTTGIVSAKGRTNVGIIDYEDFIQTDAAINPGNSGGPLVNIEGKIIGINTAIATRSGGYQGIGFAIPSNTAKYIMDSLLKEGKVRRGLLGVNIQDLTPSLAESFGRQDTNGALVSKVIPKSAADRAGIKSGDIVVKFNGQPVEGAAMLKNLVGRLRPDTPASVTVFRKDKSLALKVTLGERDTNKLKATLGSPEGGEAKASELGIEIEKVPPVLAKKAGLEPGVGVFVKDVEMGSVGMRMGLRKGDIILEIDGESVSDISSFREAVSKAKESKKVVRLKVQRGKAPIFLASPLNK